MLKKRKEVGNNEKTHYIGTVRRREKAQTPATSTTPNIVPTPCWMIHPLKRFDIPYSIRSLLNWRRANVSALEWRKSATRLGAHGDESEPAQRCVDLRASGGAIPLNYTRPRAFEAANQTVRAGQGGLEVR
jgi:hypothetical protein